MNFNQGNNGMFRPNPPSQPRVVYCFGPTGPTGPAGSGSGSTGPTGPTA